MTSNAQPASGNRTSDCPNCAEARRRLGAALAERDAAREEALEAKEALNALRVAFGQIGGRDPSFWTPGEGKPARYELADRANQAVKAVMGPVHGAIKRALGRVLGS